MYIKTGCCCLLTSYHLAWQYCVMLKHQGTLQRGSICSASVPIQVCWLCKPIKCCPKKVDNLFDTCENIGLGICALAYQYSSWCGKIPNASILQNILFHNVSCFTKRLDKQDNNSVQAALPCATRTKRTALMLNDQQYYKCTAVS